mmetsp:Transcript_133/g.251  ORF Transcript_133/g.251 Transcript_133/m.251 type:complete len:121 (-) Transcript_133:349-711(-)
MKNPNHYNHGDGIISILFILILPNFYVMEDSWRRVWRERIVSVDDAKHLMESISIFFWSYTFVACIVTILEVIMKYSVSVCMGMVECMAIFGYWLLWIRASGFENYLSDRFGPIDFDAVN